MTEALSARFFPAFLVMLDRMAQQDFFAEQAPDGCPDGHPYYWDESQVRSRLTEFLGPVAWPLGSSASAQLSDKQVVAYIEGLFQLVSKPVESWYHSYCGSSHPTKFDCPQGRYQYTVNTNAVLSRFETGLRLQNGRIKSSGSEVLAPRLADSLPTGGDGHLATLIAQALAKHAQPSPVQRLEGLQHLVDAFDRIKTIKDPSNKKRSAGLLIKDMALDEVIAEHLDGMFKTLTGLSNDLTIRHHEVGKIEIVHDVEMIDFLFYTYYNVVRLALLSMYGSADDRQQ